MKEKNQSSETHRVKGSMIYYDDDSLAFLPACASGATLYNNTLVESRSGSIKQSDKSFVMRVLVEGNPNDLRATLLNKTAELLCQLPNTVGDPMQLPDTVELVGQTPHSRVYLSEGKAIVVSQMSFDEPNPKLAGIIEHATPEQRKLLNPNLEPDDAFLMEVAQVCQLLQTSKAKHVERQKLISKSSKTSKKNG